MEVKRTERGQAGHYFGARYCLFRRNTLIEYGNKKQIVSTVGNYISPLTHKKNTITGNKWYETVAYVAYQNGCYIDIDSNQKIPINSECAIKGETIQELATNYPEGIDNAANDMHEQVVAEMMERIKDEKQV